MFNNYYIRVDLSKNAKFTYYIKNIVGLFIPSSFYQKKLESYLSPEVDEILQKRVDYYNKLTENFTLNQKLKSIEDFKKEKKKTYFFDLFEYLRYFTKEFKLSYLFGDITTIPDIPTIVKSRPIEGDNQNSILMKLNKVRHFIFVEDKIAFKDKKDLLVWRGKAHMPHRQTFVQRYHDNPHCDIGETKKNRDSNIAWQKPKMRLVEQLEYKFILSIEGNDVASNLKWVMSSNSLSFMTKPKYETWFMEGTLIPNYHYVLLKDDYSDLEEKVAYFSKHEDEALEIIANAQAHVKEFQDQEREKRLSLLVLQKYFEKSSQVMR